jgi:hypothetical protein
MVSPPCRLQLHSYAHKQSRQQHQLQLPAAPQINTNEASQQPCIMTTVLVLCSFFLFFSFSTCPGRTLAYHSWLNPSQASSTNQLPEHCQHYRLNIGSDLCCVCCVCCVRLCVPHTQGGPVPCVAVRCVLGTCCVCSAYLCALCMPVIAVCAVCAVCTKVPGKYHTAQSPHDAV